MGAWGLTDLPNQTTFWRYKLSLWYYIVLY